MGDEGILEALDAMTLKDTPPNRPDAAWRPSLLPQGAEAWAGRPGLEAHRGGAPVFARWTQVGARVFDGADGEGVAVGSGDAARSRIVVGDRLEIVADDAVNRIRLELTLAVRPGGLVTVSRRLTNTDAAAAELLAVDWLDAVLPVPRRVDTLTQFTGRWPLEKQPATAAMPVGSVTRDCRRGKTGHDSPWMFILSDGAPRWSEGEVWACHLAWSGNQTYRLDNLAAHEPLLGAGELPGPGEIMLAAGSRTGLPTSASRIPIVDSTEWPLGSTIGCARCPGAWTRSPSPVRSRSTPGRPCTSTTTRRRSCGSPTAPPP